MGIGNSKLNAAEGGEGVPSKIRPMLIGRIEEFKNRRNGEPTLSKKMLLKDADEQDDNSQSLHESETRDKFSSPKEIQPPIITTEKLSRVVPMPSSECHVVEENHPNKDNVEQELHAKGNDHDNDSDDEDESEEVGRFLCPGSPSFRIYCIEAKKKNEEECNCSTIVVHQKSRSADSVDTAESTNSNEVLQESESTTKRKGKKKFGAMKTLLKVKSLYHPLCTCTGDDKSLIVAAKATK